MSMKLNENEVRFRLTIKWPPIPPSTDPTEDNPKFSQGLMIVGLWKNYNLGDEYGDDATFGAEKIEDPDGTVTIKLESDMPEAMGEVMYHFAMEMSYYWPVGTQCTFEKVNL